MTDHEFDVAISFMSRDEGTATALRQLLAPALRVFEFTGRQEEIAGTDGLVTFRNVFGKAARLVVVLFRQGWGETPWTRVEAEAITDRFLRDGPDFLLFVMIDSAAAVPPWVPEKRIRFNLEHYGLDQAVGAIKVRVEQLGGSVGPETIAARARRAEELQSYSASTAALKSNHEGVAQVQAEAENLFAAVQRLVDEAVTAAPRLQLEHKSGGGAVGVRSPRASIYMQLVSHWTNSLTDAYLSVEDMKGGIILPGEQRRYMGERPVLQQSRYTPDRVLGVGWGWRLDAKFVTSAELAEQSIRHLFERIDDESRNNGAA